MTLRTRTWAARAAAPLLALSLLAGCGDDGDDTSEAPAATGGAEAASAEAIATQAGQAQMACDGATLESLLDPDVVLTIEFDGDELTLTGSAEVLDGAFEGNWEATGCPEVTDFEVISVEGNTVTTESTGGDPYGPGIRTTTVYEVSDGGLVTSITFMEGP